MRMMSNEYIISSALYVVKIEHQWIFFICGLALGWSFHHTSAYCNVVDVVDDDDDEPT
jgi:MFS-type transporter involved in bile tolerance (Atg22 family)